MPELTNQTPSFFLKKRSTHLSLEGIACIQSAGGVPHHQAGCVQLGGHVRQLELRVLEIREGLACIRKCTAQILFSWNVSWAIGNPHYAESMCALKVP
jgi:hypothetical protein